MSAADVRQLPKSSIFQLGIDCTQTNVCPNVVSVGIILLKLRLDVNWFDCLMVKIGIQQK